MTASERYNALSKIFIEVCDLQPVPRRGALERLCQGHPDLREELIQLLSIHDSINRGTNGLPSP